MCTLFFFCCIIFFSFIFFASIVFTANTQSLLVCVCVQRAHDRIFNWHQINNPKKFFFAHKHTSSNLWSTLKARTLSIMIRWEGNTFDVCFFSFLYLLRNLTWHNVTFFFLSFWPVVWRRNCQRWKTRSFYRKRWPAERVYDFMVSRKKEKYNRKKNRFKVRTACNPGGGREETRGGRRT